jgi:hypothetical protein
VICVCNANNQCVIGVMGFRSGDSMLLKSAAGTETGLVTTITVSSISLEILVFNSSIDRFSYFKEAAGGYSSEKSLVIKVESRSGIIRDLETMGS